jgi:hypothetical protein
MGDEDCECLAVRKLCRGRKFGGRDFLIGVAIEFLVAYSC